MTNISISAIAAGGTGLEARNTQKNEAAGGASFEAVMAFATFKAGALDFASQFLDSLTRSVKGKNSTLEASDNHVFPFSEAFQSVFGASGPLFDFINLTTTRLGLSAEQNQALQTIAINNKDITHTPANVQKIAAELKQAGIG